MLTEALAWVQTGGSFSQMLCDKMLTEREKLQFWACLGEFQWHQLAPTGGSQTHDRISPWKSCYKLKRPNLEPIFPEEPTLDMEDWFLN